MAECARRRYAFLVVAVLTTWCAKAPEPVAGQPQADPVAARVQSWMDSVVARSAVPGMTVGIALPDGRVLGLASGEADTLRHVPLTPTSRMLQGSVGKTYFGAVALQLVDEGRLGLDDPLADHLGDATWYPRLPNGADATIRQLLSHTSGIVRYEFNPAFLEDLRADPMRSFTPEDRLSYLFGFDPPFAPGEGWEYSDTNFILIAMVIERVTGNTAYDEIQRRLLGPLGLDDTVPSRAPAVDGLVNGYAGPDNPFGSFDATMSGGRLAFNPQFEWGGGGFASTAADLAEWTRRLHTGEVFGPAVTEEMLKGTPAPLGPEGSYGLGVIMMELPTGSARGHSGFMPGYRTEAYYFPDHDIAVALQVNTSHGPAFETSPLRWLDAVAALVVAGAGP